MNPCKMNFLLVALMVCFLALLTVHAGAQESDLTYSVSFTDQELDELSCAHSALSGSASSPDVARLDIPL